MCPRLADTELQYPPSPHRANAHKFITLTAHGNTHELWFLDEGVEAGGGGGEVLLLSAAGIVPPSASPARFVKHE